MQLQELDPQPRLEEDKQDVFVQIKDEDLCSLRSRLSVADLDKMLLKICLGSLNLRQDGKESLEGLRSW
jgi:hypothetical protein